MRYKDHWDRVSPYSDASKLKINLIEPEVVEQSSPARNPVESIEAIEQLDKKAPSKLMTYKEEAKTETLAKSLISIPVSAITSYCIQSGNN